MSGGVQQVGTYEIVRLVARGGMATVYEARQRALGRAVALKRLDVRTDDPTLLKRFIHESRVAASFDHPNVVTVFDFFESDGVPYIAMEYLPRGSLRPWVGRMSLPQVFGVLEGVLAGLAHAEQHGVAHRDLKPENVLVTARGAVKIADFGIAVAYNHATSRLTATGAAVGTPAYMAPEQALGQPVGAYTDLYAVGVMAFEMLSGTTPFGDDETTVAVLYRHVNDRPPPLGAVRPGVDPRLEAWVAQLLEKAPQARPDGAAAAWGSLEETIVGMLGPYWRRHCALDESAETAISPMQPAPAIAPARDEASARRAPGAGTPGAGPPPSGRSGAGRAPPQRRLPGVAWPPGRRPLVVLGSIAALAAIGTLAALGGGPRRAVRRGQATPTAVAHVRRAAAPYDFAGNGRATLVAGLPALRRGGGVALPLARRTIAEPRPRGGADGFGSALASADFNADGHADLAIGAPGRNVGDRSQTEGTVTVLYGTSRGLTGARSATFRGPGSGLPYRAARYGADLVTGDFNGDGYADLAVGAPGTDALPAEERGSGTIQILFGGPSGLRTAGARLLRRPLIADGRFGSVLAVGDVDRDGHLDLVEGAAGDAALSIPGHASFCPGGPAGPRSCRPLGGPLAGGPTALAVADVTRDGLSDIVVGIPVDAFAKHGAPAPAGKLLIWPGTRQGPAAQPVTITQESPGVPGHSQPGDAFGAALAVADVDGDGSVDMLVGAPGEDGGAGRVTLVRGGPDGHATSGNGFYEQRWLGFPKAKLSPSRYEAPGIKAAGNAFGTSIALLDVTGDGRPDLVVGVPGAKGSGEVVTMPASGAGFTRRGGSELPLARLYPHGHAPRQAQIALGGAPTP